MSSSWIEEEFQTINLGDFRLDKRFKHLALELANKPADSIHSASSDWAATKGAYRFFGNDEIDLEKIITPHFESTMGRCKNFKRIIVAQDTSYIDFKSHEKTTGLGKSFKSHGKDVKGICMHVGLAMTEKGLPLGLLYNKLWTREEVKLKPHEQTSLNIKEKESQRWLDCLKSCRKYLKNEIVVVSDREGDIYEAFEEAYKEDVDVVIRSNHNRNLNEEYNLAEYIFTLPVKGKELIEIPGSGLRKGYKSKVEIKFGKIELLAKPSGLKSKQNKNRKDLQLYVVDITDHKELHWRLLTTLVVDDVKTAKEIMSYYRLRWNVELFFKTLKTGCTIEKCRLGSGEKLIKYIGVMSVVAWRIFWMTFVSRADPEVNCDKVLMESEWKTSWLMLNRQKIKEGKLKMSDIPKSPPKLKEAIRWIAMSGGFLGRTGDKEPGIITFWRGWLKVLNGVEIYELYN